MTLFSRGVHFGAMELQFKKEITVEIAVTPIKTDKWAFYPLYRGKKNCEGKH